VPQEQVASLMKHHRCEPSAPKFWGKSRRAWKTHHWHTYRI